MTAETIAPVTVLGVVCAHRSDSYGTRTWVGESAAGLTVHLTRERDCYWVTVWRDVNVLSQGRGASVAEAEAKCEQWAMEQQALLAHVRRVT